MTNEYQDPFAAIDTSAIDTGDLALVNDAEHAGEGLAEDAGGAAAAVDPAQFEAMTLDAVARGNEAATPTPEVEAEIARMTAELKGEVVAENPSLATARGRELLLGDSLTSGETANPLPLEQILANQGEREKLTDSLFEKMSQGDIDDAEKSLLLELVTAKAKWMTPTGVVPQSLRGNPDIKAAMLKGIGDDGLRAFDKKVVESW